MKNFLYIPAGAGSYKSINANVHIIAAVRLEGMIKGVFSCTYACAYFTWYGAEGGNFGLSFCVKLVSREQSLPHKKNEETNLSTTFYFLVFCREYLEYFCSCKEFFNKYFCTSISLF